MISIEEDIRKHADYSTHPTAFANRNMQEFLHGEYIDEMNWAARASESARKQSKQEALTGNLRIAIVIH
jgi:hypothetical protein